jgi:hypothetical protein
MQNYTTTANTTTPAIWRTRAQRPAPAAALVTLDRARARKMHKTLAALGLGTEERYALAAQVAGRPVQSLTTLTESEARRTWQTARRNARAAMQAQYAVNEPGPDASSDEISAHGHFWLD